MKITEYCDLNTDREFKVAIMKKLSDLKENPQGQFSELRDKTNE